MARSIEIVIGAKDATRKAFNALRGRFSEAQKSAIAWGAGVAGAALVAARAILSAAKRAQEFNKQLGQIATLTKIPLKTIRKEVQALAGDFGLAKEELTAGLYKAISKGVPDDNVFEFMRVASKAAIGGAASATEAVDALTSVMNAFKLPATDAEKIADALFTTIKLGDTTMTDLAGSMGSVLPLANAVGISFEEIAAGIAVMTKQGASTSEAVTRIRQAILALNENLGDGWSAAMTMQEGLQALRDMAGGSQVKLKELVGRVEGVLGVLALTGESAEEAAEALDQVRNSTNATSEAFAKMADLNPFDKLAQQVDNVKTSFGAAALEADGFKKSIGTIGGVLNFINKHMDNLVAAVGAFGRANRIAFALMTGGISEAHIALAKLLGRLGNKKDEIVIKPKVDTSEIDAAEAKAKALDAFNAKREKKSEADAKKKRDKAIKADAAFWKKMTEGSERIAKELQAIEDAAEKKRKKTQDDEERRLNKRNDLQRENAELLERHANLEAGALREAADVQNRRQLQEAKDDLFSLTPEAKQQAKDEEARLKRVERLEAKKERGTLLGKRDTEFLEMEKAKARVQAEVDRQAAEAERRRQKDITDATEQRRLMLEEAVKLRKKLEENLTAK